MRIFHYLISLSLLSLLLGFAADIQTGGGLILTAFGFDNPANADFDGSNAYGLIIAIFGIAIAGTIVASLTGSNISESFVLGALASALLVFVRDYIVIYEYFQGQATWAFVVLSIIFIPMIIGYVVSLVDWWRGSD